ncbi:uncharacterized protein LOC141589906 [Silene latifolia]|uniref:uncharacterized protein LOC141589906 n=1 Tax=Silene latifolia TaxID=37657 RepID=UPI003D7795FD
MPFGLCNAPTTFQRCMMSIFSDYIETLIEVFMDDFSVYGKDFETCRLVSEKGIEVDKAKVKVIEKLPHPIKVKGVTSFLAHAKFYRRFMKDFSEIAKPLTQILLKDASFHFTNECVEAFNRIKDVLMLAPIIQPPNWDLPFEVMCNGRNYAVGAFLGQQEGKALHAIYYIKKTLDATQARSSLLMVTTIYLWPFTMSRNGLRYGVQHRTELGYNPQTSGQVEISNREIKQILEKVANKNRMDWNTKLVDTLWANRTAYKTLIGTSPYKLVYGKACDLPLELEYKAYWAIKEFNLKLELSGENKILQIQELEEFRLHYYDNSNIYKERTKIFQEKRIKKKALHKGDKVMLFNSHYKLFPGKSNSRWMGPFTIFEVGKYEDFQLIADNGSQFQVNGQRIKPYYEGEFVGEVEVLYLEPFHP